MKAGHRAAPTMRSTAELLPMVLFVVGHAHGYNDRTYSTLYTQRTFTTAGGGSDRPPSQGQYLH